jgi:hypothetical protein
MGPCRESQLRAAAASGNVRLRSGFRAGAARFPFAGRSLFSDVCKDVFRAVRTVGSAGPREGPELCRPVFHSLAG